MCQNADWAPEVQNSKKELLVFQGVLIPALSLSPARLPPIITSIAAVAALRPSPALETEANLFQMG